MQHGGQGGGQHGGQQGGQGHGGPGGQNGGVLRGQYVLGGGGHCGQDGVGGQEQGLQLQPRFCQGWLQHQQLCKKMPNFLKILETKVIKNDSISKNELLNGYF